jgi:KipI family sensor histidine kinase inhibitor
MHEYRVRPAGDTALVVDFGNRIEIDLSKKVLALARRLDALHLDGVLETVPTIRSLSVYYEPLTIPAAALEGHIVEILDDLRDIAIEGRHWQVPVCYDPEVAPDLHEVAERCKLAVDEVIGLHSSTTYHVYMLGFLPGLAYLGDLPDKLMLPRRTTPRPRIPAGSLGMAGKMTCIFPMATPCGLHLIGRSPAALWDRRLENGAVLTAGDKVRFVPITLREFERMQADGLPLFAATKPAVASAH